MRGGERKGERGDEGKWGETGFGVGNGIGGGGSNGHSTAGLNLGARTF